MFDLEAEMMTILRDTNDEKILEKIKTTKELFHECMEIKNILPCDDLYITVSKILIGSLVILLAMFIFCIQLEIYPFAALSFVLSIFLFIIAIVFFAVMNIHTDCWLDFLDKETIQTINNILEKHNMKIIETDQTVFFKKKHQKIISLSHMQ